MTERISHIPDIKEHLNRLPKSRNKVINGVRALVLLAILSPGSCVGVGAASSWIYEKVNNIPEVGDKDDDMTASVDIKKHTESTVLEHIRKFLPFDTNE